MMSAILHYNMWCAVCPVHEYILYNIAPDWATLVYICIYIYIHVFIMPQHVYTPCHALYVSFCFFFLFFFLLLSFPADRRTQEVHTRTR